MKPGTYIYVVRCIAAYKIGYTENLLGRLRTLRSQAPYPCVVEAIIARDDATAIEAALHARYRNQRIHHEWFHLTDNDVLWIRKEYSQWLIADPSTQTKPSRGYDRLIIELQIVGLVLALATQQDEINELRRALDELKTAVKEGA